MSGINFRLCVVHSVTCRSCDYVAKGSTPKRMWLRMVLHKRHFCRERMPGPTLKLLWQLWRQP